MSVSTTVGQTSMADAMSAQPINHTPPAFRVRPAGLTVEKAVAKYVELRDKVAAIKKQQVEALAPFNAAMSVLENWMLDDLNQSGAESMRTTAGTCYKAKRTTAKVHAWSETLQFILEKQAYELLEARVSKTAAQAILEETGQPVPGVAIETETTVNVRRA